MRQTYRHQQIYELEEMSIFSKRHNLKICPNENYQFQVTLQVSQKLNS